MNQVDFSWLLILEAVLPFFVLSIILILVIVKGRKKFKEAARLLILSVKNSEDKEKELLLNFLTKKLNLESKQAKKQAKSIIKERKFLLRNLISGIVDKNVEAIAQLNQDLNRVVEKYHQLEVSVAIKEDTDEVQEDDTNEDDVEDIEALKGEIKSLKQEVHITLTTLNNIFKEFSSMFGEDVPDNEMSVDQIITAMESFSGNQKRQSKAGDEQESTEAELAPSDAQDVAAVEEASSTMNAESESDPMDKPEEESGEKDGPKLESPEMESQQDSSDTPSVAKESQESQDLSESATDKSEDAETDANEAQSDLADAISEEDELDFGLDDAMDDIDSALDELELDATEEEPNWEDAFEESGDEMDSAEEDKK